MSEGAEIVKGAEKLGLFKALAGFFKRAVRPGAKDAEKLAGHALEDDVARDLAGNPLKFDPHGNPLPPDRVGTVPGANGRYTEPNGPEWSNVRQAATDKANALPRPPGPGDPKMASALEMPDGTVYKGASGQDIDLNRYPELKSVTDSVPPGNQSQYGWQCAEIDCVRQALDDGYTLDDLNGARSSAAQVRGPNSTAHGSWREPCTGDKYLLGLLGMNW